MKILIEKNVKVRTVQEPMHKIKKRYPFAKLITYKIYKDYRFIPEKDYKNRTMSVAFVDDLLSIRRKLHEMQ